MRGWMFRHIEMHNLSTIMREDHQSYNIVNLTVGTTKNSIDTSSFAWLFRKDFHGGDDGFRAPTRYLSTVDFATSHLSFRSSPTIRGEPQLTFATDITRINSMISAGTDGLPGLLRLLNLAQ
jgi:hypothetical protein